jgi:biopolymer transport protein ExbD
MIIRSGFEDRKARIEIVALIDVVFLLLVFFIYAMLSLTVLRGVDVNLPATEGALQDSSIIVTLDKNNNFIFDERTVGMDEAVIRILAETAEKKLPVLIRGDREAHLGLAIELLEKLRDSGLSSVSFQVKGF